MDAAYKKSKSGKSVKRSNYLCSRRGSVNPTSYRRLFAFGRMSSAPTSFAKSSLNLFKNSQKSDTGPKRSRCKSSKKRGITKSCLNTPSLALPSFKRIMDIPQCQASKIEESSSAEQAPTSESIVGNAKEIVAQTQGDELNCRNDLDILKQVWKLKKQLKQKLVHETEKKDELNEINAKLKELTYKMCDLNRKCESVDKEMEKLPIRLPVKSLSVCQLCKFKKLPVLDTINQHLEAMMGSRNYSDIGLSIQPSTNNVFHVTVSEIDTGVALGCILVNHAGMRQANCRGLFKKIRTFYIADTLSEENKLCEKIDFDLIKNTAMREIEATQLRNQLQEQLSCEQADSVRAPTGRAKKVNFQSKQSEKKQLLKGRKMQLRKQKKFNLALPTLPSRNSLLHLKLTGSLTQDIKN